MVQQRGIVINSSWGLYIAVIALGLSGFNIWYSMLRKGNLQFACSRWMVIGLDNAGNAGAAFAMRVDIFNSGSRPVFLNDIFLVAETHDKKSILYEPIFLFDCAQYIESIGRNDRITACQKGMVPLPIIVSDGEKQDFGYEILFMPHDRKTSVLIDSDVPFELKLFSLSDGDKKYRLIAKQSITNDDVKNLFSGSFSGVLSTASTNIRDRYIARDRMM